MAEAKRQRAGGSAPSALPGAAAPSKKGGGKKTSRPVPADPALESAERPHKKLKGPTEVTASSVDAETEYVEILEEETDLQKRKKKGPGASGSKVAVQKPRGKRIPLFDQYFPPEYWTKSERADLEVIFTRFPTPPMIGEHLVLDEYRPPFPLDQMDSAHDDPEICMMTLQNAYLPADREALKGRDFGLLSSEMFMHLKKV